MIVRDVTAQECKAHDLRRATTCAPAEAASRSADCLYCGSSQSSYLFAGVTDRLGFVPGVWSFEKCGGCQAALLSPRPHSAQLGSFYPPVYTFAPQMAEQSAFRRLFAELEYRWLYRPMYAGQAKQIARLNRGAAGKSLLDIGCGRGLRLVELRRQGFDVWGVDFDPAAADYLEREHGIPAVACNVLDVADHFSSESFDTVTAYYVVEHVLEVGRLLESAFNLLRPGGWMIAAVPLIDGLQPALLGDRWCQVREAPRHVSLPSIRSMQAALRRAGFVDIGVESDSYLLSASSAALSVVTSGTTNGAYAKPAWLSLASRLLATTAAAGSLPLAVWESFVLGRPSLGVFAAQRPF